MMKLTQANPQSVFYDLFPEEEAAELEIRAGLLRALQGWVAGSGRPQSELAEALKTTQARISDIKRGDINRFSVDRLIKLTARAGLHPRLELDAA
jgi:predicted XRE-type DNA-binding protein